MVEFKNDFANEQIKILENGKKIFITELKQIKKDIDCIKENEQINFNKEYHINKLLENKNNIQDYPENIEEHKEIFQNSIEYINFLIMEYIDNIYYRSIAEKYIIKIEKEYDKNINFIQNAIAVFNKDLEKIQKMNKIKEESFIYLSNKWKINNNQYDLQYNINKKIEEINQEIIEIEKININSLEDFTNILNSFDNLFYNYLKIENLEIFNSLTSLKKYINDNSLSFPLNFITNLKYSFFDKNNLFIKNIKEIEDYLYKFITENRNLFIKNKCSKIEEETDFLNKKPIFYNLLIKLINNFELNILNLENKEIEIKKIIKENEEFIKEKEQIKNDIIEDLAELNRYENKIKTLEAENTSLSIQIENIKKELTFEYNIEYIYSLIFDTYLNEKSQEYIQQINKFNTMNDNLNKFNNEIEFLSKNIIS